MDEKINEYHVRFSEVILIVGGILGSITIGRLPVNWIYIHSLFFGFFLIGIIMYYAEITGLDKTHTPITKKKLLFSSILTSLSFGGLMAIQILSAIFGNPISNSNTIINGLSVIIVCVVFGPFVSLIVYHCLIPD